MRFRACGFSVAPFVQFTFYYPFGLGEYATLSVCHAMPCIAMHSAFTYRIALHRIVSFIHSFIHGLAGFTVFIVTFILKTEPNLVFCLASFSVCLCFVHWILVFIVPYRRTLKNVSKHLTLLCTHMCVLEQFSLVHSYFALKSHIHIVLGKWL